MADSHTPFILLMGGEKSAQNQLSRLLDAEGYSLAVQDFALTKAINKQGALDIRRQKLPDLIVLPLTEPFAEGIATCSYLRHTPETAEIPILVVTAADPIWLEKAFAAGADDCIRTPIEPIELRQRVRYLSRLGFHPASDDKSFKRIREERDLLRTVIDKLPDFVYVKDREDRFVMVNQTVAQALGMSTPKEVVGKLRSSFEFPQRDSPGTYRHEDRQVLEEGIAVYNKEIPYVDGTGKSGWLRISKMPLRDHTGQIIGLVGINYDITDQKQAEEQLRQIVGSARCLMWFGIVQQEEGGDFHWTIEVINELAAQVFLPLALSPDQTYTDAWLASRSAEDRAQIKEVSQAALQAGQSSYVQEFRCRQQDGTLRWLHEEVVVKPLIAGRWSLVGVCTDISESKHHEQLLQQSRDQLEQRVKERTIELEILRQASLSLTSSLELNQVLEKTLGYALQLIPASNAHIYLYDGQTLTFGAAQWAGGVQHEPFANPRPQGLTYTVARSGQRMVVSDMSEHPLFAGQNWKGGIAAFPLRTGKRVWGVMTVAFENQSHNFDEDELRVLELLADQVAIVIQNVQYVHQIEAESVERRRAEEAERDQRLMAEALRDAAAELSGTLELDEVMDLILTHAVRVVPHDSANIMLVEENHARVVRHRGHYADNMSKIAFNIEATPNIRRVMQTGEPHVINDTRSYPGWVKHPELDWIHSNVMAPIKVGAHVVGLINLDSAQPGMFTEDHAQQLLAFANQAGIAFENARLYDALQQYAEELERRVAERTAELEKERAQLHALLNAMGEGVTGVIMEGGTSTRFNNRTLVEMLGYDVQENAPDILQYADMTAEELAVFRKQVTDQIARQGIWRGELKLRRADNTFIDASLTGTSIKGSQGQAIGRVMIARDITKGKSLQRQQALFMTNASHELRTPIANITTRLYLIRRQPERLEEHLSVMELVVERLKVLVENMLDLSHFERGMIELHPQRMVLQALVEQVLHVQGPEAEIKGIQLTTDLAEQPLYVMADPGQMPQVLTNVLINAIQYTPPDGQIHITVGDDPDNSDLVSICIEDTGIGVAPELLPHVFDPFFRATEEFHGTGLGLSIARQIVERHNGTITLESILGEGSQLWIRLPRLD